VRRRKYYGGGGIDFLKCRRRLAPAAKNKSAAAIGA